MWVLHAEQLCLGILIQGLELLAGLVLRLTGLLVSRCCGDGSRPAHAAGPRLTREELLRLRYGGGGLAACAGSLGHAGGSFGRDLRLTRHDCRRSAWGGTGWIAAASLEGGTTRAIDRSERSASVDDCTLETTQEGSLAGGERRGNGGVVMMMVEGVRELSGIMDDTPPTPPQSPERGWRIGRRPRRGYIVAAPSSYHEFTSPAPLAYDAAGTDAGNAWKVAKRLAAYDEDATLAIDTLLALPTCTGRVGATGMCLGGHLAFRAAMDARVHAAVCYFATDIHSHSLGEGLQDDSLRRVKEIKGELVMIFGKRDTHVPPAGRDLIRQTLHDAGVVFSFYEPAWAQHAFIRDELSKGRYDAALAGVCFAMLLELFGRTLNGDLGARAGKVGEVEDVC
nr:putative carboxymethylenebutenolidase [Quercus suber]